VAVGKRLRQRAAAGEVLLGEETHALVAHAVDAAPLESPGAKARRHDVTAFRLESVAADATALPRREDVPLVGRERER
jgi:class 3 adenylate cyclase